MELLDFLDMGYEVMATTSNVDDALELVDYYMDEGVFDACAVKRYKRTPGQEDAYAVLLRSS